MTQTFNRRKLSSYWSIPGSLCVCVFVSSSIVISLAPLKGIHGFNFLDTDLTHLSGWFSVYTCLTRRSHGSKCNSLLLTLRQSLPQVAVYFLATVLSSALARCHRNRGKRFPGLRWWQHRKNAGAQGTRPCVDSFFLSVEAILKEFCNSNDSHLQSSVLLLFRKQFSASTRWFRLIWSPPIYPLIKHPSHLPKKDQLLLQGGWTSEFATFAVAGAIDLDSRYAGPLRVIRNEEWDENDGSNIMEDLMTSLRLFCKKFCFDPLLVGI